MISMTENLLWDTCTFQWLKILKELNRPISTSEQVNSDEKKKKIASVTEFSEFSSVLEFGNTSYKNHNETIPRNPGMQFMTCTLGEMH